MPRPVRPLIAALLIASAAASARATSESERTLLRSAALEEHAQPKIKIGGFIQFRYSATHAKEVPAPGDPHWALGFMMRRAEVYLKGPLPLPESSFKIKWNMGSSNGGFAKLDDAYANKTLEGSTSLRVGQFKVPLVREQLISSSKQLCVERSLTGGSIYNPSRMQGVMLTTDVADNANLRLAINDGTRGQNRNVPGTDRADIGGVARLELYSTKDRKRFEDYTSFRGSGDMATIFGIGGLAQTGGATLGTPNQNFFQSTADIGLEGDGWNAAGAILVSYLDMPGSSSIFDFGATVQGGFFVTDLVELFARYSTSIASERNPAGSADLQTINGGFTRYLIPDSNAAKIMVDIGVLLGDLSNSNFTSPGGLGYLTTPGNRQVSARIQLQVVF